MGYRGYGIRFKEIALVSDFETTVNNERTEVWAAASIKLADPTAPEYVCVQTSIDEYLKFLFKLDENLLIYFHNLKFDGSFLISWVLSQPDWEQYKNGNSYKSDYKFGGHKKFTYTITDSSVWYEVKFAYNGKIIRFVDSLKLVPMSIQDIGEGFNTKYKKLTMEYKGDMKAGGTLTKEQTDYIKNDVLIPHEIIKRLRKEGHRKTTIGANCMAEFKKMRYGARAYDNSDIEYDFRREFPNLFKTACPFEGFKNADEYIRKAYHGGMTTVVKGKENKVFGGGCTFDYNSMYPSVQLANRFPVGEPHWFKGALPKEARENNRYYFIRIKTRFYLKEEMLPTVQIKDNIMYNGKEWLETSDVLNENGVLKPYQFIVDKETGRKKFVQAIPTLTLTMTDYQLLQHHYRLVDCVELDGCWFETKEDIFKDYVNYWAERKINANTPAERCEAKLFANNLYGKFSQSNKNDFKHLVMFEDGTIRSERIKDKNDDVSSYIPVGAAICSFARAELLAAGQANYKYLVYMDTDSIHCCCDPSKIKGIKIHDKNFGAWKLETCWDQGIFVRAKTYIEHVYNPQDPLNEEDCYYNVKCSGMGSGPKKYFVDGLESGKYKITDFKRGLKLPGNLRAHFVNGGTVLMEQEYELL